MQPEDVHVPEDALSEKFLAATGPGGQNVNKLCLPPPVSEGLRG
jgi:ribosome-associated protein